MGDIPILWPDDVGTETKMITPLAIFRQQAAALVEKTKGELEAEVKRTTDDDGDLRYTFRIVAHALQYSYNLFVAYHNPILIYPVTCKFRDRGVVKCNDQDELISWLREVLQSDETKRVVQSLRAQLRE